MVRSQGGPWDPAIELNAEEWKSARSVARVLRPRCLAAQRLFRAGRPQICYDPFTSAKPNRAASTEKCAGSKPVIVTCTSRRGRVLAERTRELRAHSIHQPLLRSRRLRLHHRRD
jgi:hypothetical protein